MSVKPVVVYDERFIEKPAYGKIYKGAAATSFQSAKPIGGTPNNSQNNWNFNVTPSSFLDRKPIIKGSWVQLFKADNASNGDIAIDAASKIALGQNVSLTEYPINTCVLGVSNVALNGKDIQGYNMATYQRHLLRLGDLRKNMSKSIGPSCPELSFISTFDGYLTTSSSNSNYNDANPVLQYLPNGSWNSIVLVDPSVAFAGKLPAGVPYIDAGGVVKEAIWTSGGATPTAYFAVQITNYEPLMLPPFLMDEYDTETALINVNNVVINTQISSSTVHRAFRTLDVGNAKNVSAVPNSYDFTKNECELTIYYNQMAPPLNMSVPKSQILHTYGIDSTMIQSNKLAAPGATSSVISIPNVAVGVMPSRFLIWAVPQTPPPTSLNNYYYRIASGTVDIQGGTQNIMANLNQPFLLFDASVKSGLAQDYLSWLGNAFTLAYKADGTIDTAKTSANLVSGPVVLTPSMFGFDLPATEGSNVLANKTLTFNVTVYNNTADAAATPMNIHIAQLYDNYLTIDDVNKKVDTNKANFSASDALQISKNIMSMDDEGKEEGGLLQKVKFISNSPSGVIKSAKNRGK